LTRIVEEFHKNPPTKEELERAKKNFANEAERTLNNHENIGVELSEYIALGDWRLFFKDRDDAQAVTADQVKDVAAKYYRRDNRVVGIFQPEDAPQRAELPAVPAVAEVLKDFKPKQAVQQAEAFDPSNANIDKRTKIVNIGGIQLAMLSKKNRGETVNVSVRFNSGDEKSLFGKGRIGTMTGAMLSRGTTKFSRTQIADESDKLKMQGGVTGLFANYQTTRPNLAASIKLAAHVMREPSFPEAEFEQLKKQLLTQIESQKSDPQAVATVALGQHFNQFPRGDVRYSPTLAEAEEDVKAVTLQQLKDYHKQFYAAAKGQIAVVGDFDEAEVEKAVREAFGEWKGGVPYVRFISPFKDIAPANKSFETPDKENAMFIARLNLNAQDTDADFAALWVANYIMGGGAGLDSRLAARIREKDGLSYGAGSQLGVGSVDRSASWTAFAIGAPQNVAKIEVAFKEEVARALKDGFTAEELAKAKSGAIQQRLQQRAQDGPLSNGIRNNLYLGRTYAWSADLEAKIQALKPDDINAAFRKYIDPKKITIIKAGDFVKAAKVAAEGKK
ncbi:MAG: insulinase family protein, partial [Betaproteobacteria bacterium]|nr:insulinase family protein [Betaproteobacteria bacterium]